MFLGKNKIIGVGMALSGAVHEYDGFREPDRLAQLMADAAMRRGVADVSNTAGAALDQHAGASDRGSETFGSHIHHTHRSRNIRLAYTSRRAGVPQIFPTSVQLSGTVASGCAGVAVSHPLCRLLGTECGGEVIKTLGTVNIDLCAF